MRKNEKDQNYTRMKLLYFKMIRKMDKNICSRNKV